MDADRHPTEISRHIHWTADEYLLGYQIAYSSEWMMTDIRSSEIKNVSLSGMDRRGFASRATQ